MQQGLAAYGEANPDNPWPYCIVGVLLRAEGRGEIADQAEQRFWQLCADPSCRQTAGRLNVTSMPAK